MNHFTTLKIEIEGEAFGLIFVTMLVLVEWLCGLMGGSSFNGLKIKYSIIPILFILWVTIEKKKTEFEDHIISYAQAMKSDLLIILFIF